MMFSLLRTKKVFLQLLKIVFVLLLLISAYQLLKEMPIRHHGWVYRDKVEHASLFFCLTILALFLFKPYRLILVFFLACYGGVTEYLQSTMTKTRTGSVEDWLADLAGIFLACLIAWVLAIVVRRLKLTRSDA